MNTETSNILNLQLSDHWRTLFSLHLDKSTCDLVFVCEGYKIPAHKLVILLAIPELERLINNYHCQQEIVIFIQDLKKNDMEYALERLYLHGENAYLLDVLNLKSEESVDAEEEVFENDKDDNNTKSGDDPVASEDLIRGASCKEEILDEELLLNPNRKEDIYDVKQEIAIFQEVNILNGKDNVLDGTNAVIDEYIFTKQEVENIDMDNPCFDSFVGKLFENEETSKRLVQLYNETHNFCLTTSGKIQYACYLGGRKRKSESLGIRQTKSNYTGCLVKINFYKKANGLVRMTKVELKHNHELDENGPRGKNKKNGLKIRGFDWNWNSSADAIVRDGVLSNRNVLEMEEMMKSEGVSSVPTLATISRRVTIIKKSLGMFLEVKQSVGKKKREHLEKNVI